MQWIQSEVKSAPNAMCLEFSELLDRRDPQASKPLQGIVLACEAPNIASAGRPVTRVTLLVDEILGPEEVVVRPALPTILKHPRLLRPPCRAWARPCFSWSPPRRGNSKPLAPPHPASNHVRVLSLPNRQSTPGHAARPRVLVVDDSITARKRVVGSLQRYPVDITEACNGRDALHS